MAISWVPSVIEQQLVFTLPDPGRDFVHVALECDDAIAGHRRFRRTATGWMLAVPRPDLARLEYRLVVTTRGGVTDVVCDPGNPERVQTAFGERSVALMPGYQRPGWLDVEHGPGERHEREYPDARLEAPIPITVWHPEGLPASEPAPLLVVNDGPEYADLAGLVDYAAAMIADSTLPPFRVALMQPVFRDEWYAGNPDYIGVVLDAVDDIRADFATRDGVVAVGASLGGLCALLLALSGEGVFSGAFSQSGSFFDPGLDAQESSYPHFERVAGAVALIRAEASAVAPLLVGLTCGALEENRANNVAMRDALTAAGHTVDYRDVPDLHNYTAWRDSLHPALTDLLRAAWDGQG